MMHATSDSKTGLRSRRHSNDSSSHNNHQTGGDVTTEWSHHMELEDIFNDTTPTNVVTFPDEYDSDDDSGLMEDNDDAPDYDLPPAVLIYDHIMKKRAREAEKKKREDPHYRPSPDEIILEDNYGITWFRFWMISGLCLCTLLCLFGIITGIVLNTTGKCLFRSGCNHEKAAAAAIAQQHDHEHLDQAGNPHNIPLPRHGADYIFRVCSKDALTTGTEQDRTDARSRCEEDCAAATCCWHGWQLCHGEAECRAYDSCENLWHVKPNDDNNQDSVTSTTTANNNNAMQQPVEAPPQNAAEAAAAAPQNAAAAVPATTTTTTGTSYTNYDHPNNNNNNNNLDAHELSTAIQQACQPHQNLSNCLALCQAATCCFTTNTAESCAQDTVQCGVYQPCDILYHPEKYNN